MTQQGTHVVHLPVAGTRVATRTVDFFHDDRGLYHAQARSAVGLRNQRRQPACLRECIDKCFWIAALFIDLPKILSRELFAQCANGIADILMSVAGMGHGISLGMTDFGVQRIHWAETLGSRSLTYPTSPNNSEIWKRRLEAT